MSFLINLFIANSLKADQSDLISAIFFKQGKEEFISLSAFVIVDNGVYVLEKINLTLVISKRILFSTAILLT